MDVLTAPRLAFLLLAAVVTGCGAAPSSDLPEVPAIDTAQMRGVARGQIEKVYADAAQRPAEITPVAELALVLHAYGYLPAAEIAYRHALALRPADARLRYLHAFTLGALGELDLARGQYASMTGDPEFGPYGWARLARLELEAGNVTAALGVAERGLDVAPDDLQLRFLRGRALFEQGDAAGARAEFDTVLAAGAHLPEVYYAASRAARELGDDGGAAEYARVFEQLRETASVWPDKLLRAVANKRRTASTLVERSRRRLNAGGDIDEAVQELEGALTLDPEAYEAHIALVGLYGSTGRYDKAEDHYRRAMELAPDTAQLHFNIATTRVAQRRYAEAAASLGRAIELAPSYALAHAILARIRHQQGATQEARTLLDEAVRLAPGDMTVLDIVLPMLVDEGRFEQAAALLDTGAATGMTNARRQLWRARVSRLAGRPDEAREALAAARRQLDETPNTRLERTLEAETASLDASGPGDE